MWTFCIWTFAIWKKKIKKSFVVKRGIKDLSCFPSSLWREVMATVGSQVPLCGTCNGHCSERWERSHSTVISKKSLAPRQNGSKCSPGQQRPRSRLLRIETTYFAYYLENNYSGQGLGLQKSIHSGFRNHTKNVYGAV